MVVQTRRRKDSSLSIYLREIRRDVRDRPAGEDVVIVMMMSSYGSSRWKEEHTTL